MPKLLQINECLHFSTGRISQAIGEVAINHGWDSIIAYSSRELDVPCKSKVLKIGTKIGPYIHYLENRVFDREGLSSRNSTKKFIKKIEQLKPDVIQLHNIHDHWLNYQLLYEYLNQTDIKIVWTFHDCWAFTGHCFHFVTKKCERWKTGCFDCPLKNEYPKTIFDRSEKNYELKKRLFGEAKNLSIVSCSDWMGNFVKQSFLNNKLHIIKNGIDLRIFTPSLQKTSIVDGRYRILAVSNVWNKEKGFDDIFALRALLSEDYIITMVGLSSEQAKNLPYGIIGVQHTQNVHELVELYSSSDVLVNPTYADTFPTVNLEALACGTPVITYKTGGSPETVDEKTGIVIEQGNVEALKESIKQMRENPLSSDACRKRAEECFDKNKCFEEYIKLYNKLLNE